MALSIMPSSPKRSATPTRPDEQQIREQEVLRANKELAAYFKGRRTEREARAALKIIKAFVRDRERRDAGRRPPLPGAHPVKPAKEIRSRRRPRRTPGEKPHESAVPAQA